MTDEASYWGYAPAADPLTVTSQVAATAVAPVEAPAIEAPKYSPEQMGGLLDDLAKHPELQTQIIGHVTEHRINDPQVIAGMIEQRLQSINQSSVNAEASLIQGGYDPTVANAVSASQGVGTDKAQIEQAAADFARDASRAVQNGQTLDQVRTADPNLSMQAQQAIYEQVAQQQGTSAAEIARKAEADKAATMSALQGAVFGGAALATGAAATTDPNYNIFTATAAGPAAAEQTGLMPAMFTKPLEERPYGVAAERMDYKDLGTTTAAIAALGQFTPQSGLPDVSIDRGQSVGRA